MSDNVSAMPGSLWNETDRQTLLQRFDRLEPAMRPRWGRMNAMQMITHLTEWMRMATGELPSAPRRKFMRYPVVKQMIIYWMPWPKGVPTAPELLERKAAGWEAEHAAFAGYLKSFGELRKKSDWPEHPVFGILSTGEWGVLGYRHTDHHLRQFGV